ncbi:DUF6284 family protein [Fodinicola feengrottensis]|uniref:Uncharacterized protein n=1 Tax=Fodinicola feengrottensis TaxID=435914 RepID=A0ABN2JE16_9ACTN|nr:DUF6284 family protein [Fodinicola feengrottensis]
MRNDPMEDGPTDAELLEIEREWPALEAELALVDEEIRILTVEGGPTLLDWRRLRRAEHRALMARHLVYGTPAPAALDSEEVA